MCVLVFVATLIVAGNVCEFSGEAHGAKLAPERQSDQSGEPHHDRAAHLTTCENEVVSTSSAHPVAHDAAMVTPRLEAFVELQDVQGVLVSRLPEPRRGPPLFILHAALLI